MNDKIINYINDVCKLYRQMNGRPRNLSTGDNYQILSTVFKNALNEYHNNEHEYRAMFSTLCIEYSIFKILQNNGHIVEMSDKDQDQHDKFDLLLEDIQSKPIYVDIKATYRLMTKNFSIGGNDIRHIQGIPSDDRFLWFVDAQIKNYSEYRDAFSRPVDILKISYADFNKIYNCHADIFKHMKDKNNNLSYAIISMDDLSPYCETEKLLATDNCFINDDDIIKIIYEPMNGSK